MARRLTAALFIIAMLPVGSSRAEAPSGTCTAANQGCFELESTIAFTSTRDNPFGTSLDAAELYLMRPDGSELVRLTDNTDGDVFAALSPDGKKIVFDSNRNRGLADPPNTSDLFWMNTDGSGQTFLTRGSSATWSPDSKLIAFHASASGAGLPTRTDPGAATSDSDIFVANLDDLAAGVEQPVNITDTPGEIEDDADWSPNGTKLVFTIHPTTDDPQRSNQAEIYLANPDGSGRVQLTHNHEEERAPTWSPNGSQILYSCRIGGGSADFELCVVEASGATPPQQLTSNAAQDLTATWAPDGSRIVFHRIPPFELWTMNPDGTAQTQLTDTPGINGFANWGELRVRASRR
jgi:TolB protein